MPEDGLGDVVRLLREIRAVMDSIERVRKEIADEILLRSLLYSFPSRGQPSLDELQSLVKEYMGLEDEDIVEYLQRVFTRHGNSHSRLSDDAVHNGAKHDHGKT